MSWAFKHLGAKAPEFKGAETLDSVFQDSEIKPEMKENLNTTPGDVILMSWRVSIHTT